MRDSEPLYRAEEPFAFWALSRYEAVHAALIDWQAFTTVAEPIPFGGFDSAPTEVLRAGAARAVSPGAFAQLELMARGVVRRLLEDASGTAVFDFVHDLARPFVTEVACELVGVHADDRALAGELAWEQLTCEGPERRRLSRSVEDLLTSGARSAADARFARLVIETGLATGVKLMTSGLLAFDQAPDEWLKVVEGPARMWTAVDEIGRMDPPVPYVTGRNRTDVRYHGSLVPEGSLVFLLLASANRDERVFDEPDVFSVDRKFPKAPLLLGFGDDLCMGASVARLCTRVAFEEMAGICPQFSLAPEGIVPVRLRGTPGYGRVPVALGSPARSQPA